jgi:molybdopterin molybdotransferase
MDTTAVDNLISISQARLSVLEACEPLLTETIPLSESIGRVLGHDITSEQELPSFRSSAMDGFAVVAGEAQTLRVVGESRAGHPMGKTLEAGQAAKISTGAVVPSGADAVVPIEHCQQDGSIVSVPETQEGSNVRYPAEDIRAGDLVLKAGTPLFSFELAVLAALGQTEVPCSKQPSVAVLATGDELVDPEVRPELGQLRNSNSLALAAAAQQAGGVVIDQRLVADDESATRQALAHAISQADVVCVSGGVSVGEHDHVKSALSWLGVRPVFWKVAIKPGKPTWFGTHDSCLVFGLPGNPVSAMVTFHLFVRPALRALLGANTQDTRGVGVLDESIDTRPGREQVIRCKLSVQDDGWHVSPTRAAQDSHILTSMLDTQAFALIPAGSKPLEPGTRVEIELLNGP